jgi:hypothetical protein
VTLCAQAAVLCICGIYRGIVHYELLERNLTVTNFAVWRKQSNQNSWVVDME